MSPVPSYAAKRDANEREVIDALEAEGCAVQQLSAPGVPDLLVWLPKADSYELVEVKGPAGNLTPVQTKWWGEWAKKGGRKPWMVRGPEEARAMVRHLTGSGLDTPAHDRRRA